MDRIDGAEVTRALKALALGTLLGLVLAALAGGRHG